MYCNLCGKKQSGVQQPVKKGRYRRPKGSGSIVLYKGRARPYIARGPHKEYVGAFEDKASAVIALDRWLSEHTINPLTDYTLKQVYEAWSSEHYKTLSKSGIQQNTAAFAKANNLHAQPMKSLKTADFQAVVTALAEQGKSLSTCQKQKQFFSMLCKWSMANDIINKNYADFVVVNAKEKDPAKNDRVFTMAEIAKIEGLTADERYGKTAKITMILIYSGFRINELLYLKKENVNLSTGIMIGGEKTKAGRDRHVPIHHRVRTYVEEFMLSEGEYLIPSATGQPLNNDSFGRKYKAMLESVGITGVKVHTTRHTTSTLLLASGIEPNVVKAILGHASISTTVDVYDHPSDERLVAGISSI